MSLPYQNPVFLLLSLPSFIPDDAQVAIQGIGEKKQLTHFLSAYRESLRLQPN